MERALIIVDLQNDFCKNGALEVKDGDKIVPVVNRLIDRFYHVVATKDWHKLNSRHFEKWPVHCVEHSKGAAFHPEVATEKIEKIFLKGTSLDDDGYSGFEATNESLENFLRKNKVEEVYICGLALDYCVKLTALDAVKKGFDTYIVLDATRAVSQNSDEINRLVEELKEKGVKFINSRDILKNEK